MENYVILHQMAQLFIMIGFGYLLYKFKMMDDEFDKKLTRLVLDGTLPLMVLASVLEQPEERDYGAVANMIIISVFIYIVLPIVAFIIVKCMRLPLKQQGMYMCMLTYGNVGFMGFPVLNAMYGGTAVFYAAILNIVFNISVFSVGTIMVDYRCGDTAETAGGSHRFNFKSLLSPGTIISLLSIAIYFTGIIFPDDIVSACSSIGNLTSPLAMMLIGAALAKMDVRSVFDDWRIYPFVIVKQIVMPLIMWLIMRVFIHDDIMLGICTILMMMPVANISVMLANLHGHNEELAARGVFLTTLFSAVSVPLMLYFLV